MNQTTEPQGDAKYIFVMCQYGAEAACRQEIMASDPLLRLAFSRPGFITFKVVPLHSLPHRFVLRSVLARTCGWSLGNIRGSDLSQLVAQVAAKPEMNAVHHIHVFEPDRCLPGESGWEPGKSVQAAKVAELFANCDWVRSRGINVNRIAKPNQRVLDIILLETDQWWIGQHDAIAAAGRWPGGVPRVPLDVEEISRAYFKLYEALQWSGVRVNPGDVWVEIGSAPGGACQLLLERGAQVIAVDPAELDARISCHPNLIHIRRRGKEIRKRDLKNARWLLADLNTTPKYSLDTVADVVNHSDVHIVGMILTLKLPDWELISHLPDYFQRIKQWGFQVVKARQLAFNRQEFCLFAARDQFARRASRKKKAAIKNRANNT